MSEHHDGLNSAGDIALRDLEPAGRDEVTEDKVPAEPLTDLQDSVDRRTKAYNELAEECDLLRTQHATQQAALRELLDLLDRIAGWPENVTCPECGGPMMSRANRATGQRFWGCKRYPVCKGTLNTDGDARSSSYRDELEGEGDYAPSERQRQNDHARWRHPCAQRRI